jgi:hypothetical protein
MALQSQLFRGDPKLEAAAVSDAAHIVPGATGEHVRKIQQALIQLEGAAIAPDGVYGPATARAVLAFKQKRNIVNRSYQATADNIVGKMTIAALDKELLGKESPPPKEGVAICKLTDGANYGGGGLMLGFALSGSPAPAGPWSPPVPPAPPVPPPRPKTPLKHALEVMGLAKTWANSALTWLRSVRGFYQQHGNSNWPAPALALFEAVNVHFHLRALPRVEDQPPLLDKLIANYTQILTILNKPDLMGDDPTLYTDKKDPRFGAYATAHIGGFDDNTVAKKVWFHGLFLTASGQKARCAIILHECGHSVATGLHYAYGHPRASGGTAGEPLTKGVKHPRKYADLTPDEALHNADTYATFAAHASTNDASPTGDIRPGAHALSI